MAEPGWLDRVDPDEARDRLRRTVAEEAVVHLDDLLLRRTTWAMDPTGAAELGERVCELLGWDPARREVELVRLRDVAGARTERLTA
jgi:glycerol-3-phosphate dehydrogenase